MEKIKIKRVFIAACAANLSVFATGTCIGWTSPILFKMKSQGTKYSLLSHPIDSSDEAWICSILALGACIAPFAAGFFADRIGRKWMLLFSSIFFIISYILMLLAFKLWIIFVGRLFQGFGCGIAMAMLPLYIGEISSDNVRGALGTLMTVFLSAGIVYSYAIGPYVSYRALQYFCLAVPVVFDVFFFFIPESPYYHIQKGQKAKAIKSLQFLRGQSENAVIDEMAKIQASVDEAMANKNPITDIIKVPGNRKAFLICSGLIAFQQCNGIDVVLFYTESIFHSANTNLNPALSTIIIGLVQLLASGLTAFIADRLSRRIILMTSAIVMSLSLASLGAFFYMQLKINDTSDVTWLPVPALIIYMFAFNIGLAPIPWVMLGEMFSTNIKSIAVSICASICWFLAFLITFSYPFLEPFGSYYIFWAFSIFCILAFFFTLFFVMETKGLSLQEIQDRLNNKKI